MGASRWAFGKSTVLGFIDLDVPQLSLIKGVAEGHYDLSSASDEQLQSIAKDILQPYLAQKLSLSVNGKAYPLRVVQFARGDGDRFTISVSASPVLFNQAVNKVSISYSLLREETGGQHMNLAFGYLTDDTGDELQRTFVLKPPSLSATFDASTTLWELSVNGVVPPAPVQGVSAVAAAPQPASGVVNAGPASSGLAKAAGAEKALPVAALGSPAANPAAPLASQGSQPAPASQQLAANAPPAPAAPSGPQKPPSASVADWASRVWQTLRQFVPLGIEHILSGYDHIAFLLAIIVIELSIRQILKIITAFTVAHSFTLLLAAMEIVRLPSRLVESAIAFSICYVALENVFKTKSDYRWAIAFGFGLIHGFGFASALRDLILGKANLLLSVLSFNFGVELGQLMLIGCMLPVLYLLKKRIGFKIVTATASTAVFAVGFAWLIERVFLLKLLWF